MSYIFSTNKIVFEQYNYPFASIGEINTQEIQLRNKNYKKYNNLDKFYYDYLGILETLYSVSEDMANDIAEFHKEFLDSTKENLDNLYKNKYNQNENFKRNKFGIPTTIKTIKFNPNRNVRTSLNIYTDGEKQENKINTTNEFAEINGLKIFKSSNTKNAENKKGNELYIVVLIFFSFSFALLQILDFSLIFYVQRRKTNFLISLFLKNTDKIHHRLLLLYENYPEGL